LFLTIVAFAFHYQEFYTKNSTEAKNLLLCQIYAIKYDRQRYRFCLNFISGPVLNELPNITVVLQSMTGNVAAYISLTQ
jgi:hypothetical protein